MTIPDNIPLPPLEGDYPELTKVSYEYLRMLPTTYYTMEEIIAMSSEDYKEFMSRFEEK